MKDEILLMLRGGGDEYPLFRYAYELTNKINGNLTLLHIIVNQKEVSRILNIDINDSVSTRELASRKNINKWRLSVNEVPNMETLVIDDANKDIITWFNNRNLSLVIIGHHRHVIDISLANQLIKKLSIPIIIYPLDKAN